MLGIYPNAGQDFYYIGSPTFSKATVKLAGGKSLVLNAPAASVSNKYVGAVKRNGQFWPKAWIRHSDIAHGAEFEFTMNGSPSAWGRTPRPPSLTKHISRWTKHPL